MKFGVFVTDLSFFSSSNPSHLCLNLFCNSSQMNLVCKQFGLGFFSEYTETDHIVINLGELSSFSNKIKFISYQSPPRYMYLNNFQSRTDINNTKNTVQHHLYITIDSVFVFADFSTSGYDHDFKVKIQVRIQNKVLEIKLRVVLTKVGLLPKDESFLTIRISQGVITELGQIRLFAGNALRTSIYVLFIGYKAPSEPAYASKTLVQII